MSIYVPASLSNFYGNVSKTLQGCAAQVQQKGAQCVERFKAMDRTTQVAVVALGATAFAATTYYLWNQLQSGEVINQQEKPITNYVDCIDDFGMHYCTMENFCHNTTVSSQGSSFGLSALQHVKELNGGAFGNSYAAQQSTSVAASKIDYLDCTDGFGKPYCTRENFCQNTTVPSQDILNKTVSSQGISFGPLTREQTIGLNENAFALSRPMAWYQREMPKFMSLRYFDESFGQTRSVTTVNANSVLNSVKDAVVTVMAGFGTLLVAAFAMGTANE